MVAPSSRQFSGGSWDLRKTERRQSHSSIDFPDRRKGERRTFGYPDFDNSQNQSMGEANHNTGSILCAQPSSFDSKFIEKR